MRPLPIAPTDELRIGAKLRAARLARGHTLESLASAAGLTKGFLSRVERDEASPSVVTLVRLCEVMTLDVGSLFDTPELDVVDRRTAPRIDLGGDRVDERLMTPRGQSRLQLVHSVIEAGGSAGSDLYTLDCDVEVVYVLRGALDVVLADRVQRLEAGQAGTFSGREPHTWSNVADGPTEALWVLVPAAAAPSAT